MLSSDPNQRMPRFIAGAFGVLFGGIGVTVLAFLWGAPFDEFGSPPLFFRIFGSFIALAFVMGGGAMVFGAASVRLPTGISRTMGTTGAPPSPAAPAVTYTCPHCGAPLSKNATVSPLGDTRCTHCSAWFNIHGRTA